LCNVPFSGRTVGSESELSVTADAIRTWQKTEGGLPSDQVTTVFQTRDGFLWVGTSAGLVRFDGIKFTGIKLPVSSAEKLVGITALCEDSDGELWIGTQEDGLFRLARGQPRHLTVKDGLLDNAVTCLAMDKTGRIWVGGKSGLSFWTGNEFKHFTTKDGLPDEFISNVHVARSGTVWITTRSGMCQFIDGRISPYGFQTQSQGRNPEYLGAYEDRNGNLWAFGDTYLINLAEGKRFNYFHSSESASVRIWSLCEGRDGRLWIGTSGRGLFCFEGGRFQPVILGENRWLSDVRCICEDFEGNLWLGTSGGGLLQLRPQSVQVFQASQGLPAGMTTALALDAKGRVFAALLRGGVYVGENGRFERVDSPGLSVQNLVSSLCVDGGALWAATLGDGLYELQNEREIHFTTADGLKDDHVLAVCADGEGTIWASTASGGMHFLSGQRMIPLDSIVAQPPKTPVTAIIPAISGGIWMGTQDGAVLRLKKGDLTTLKAAEATDGHAVLALHEGNNSRLWIGTQLGLGCIGKGINAHWNTQKGLPNGVVAGIAEDNAKNLWLATSSGIYRVNRNDLDKALANPQEPLVCKLMSEAKTLPEPAAAFCGTRVVLSKAGALWFATSDGVLQVDTRQSVTVPVEIPLYIESATFNNQNPISLLQDEISPPALLGGREIKAPMNSQSLEVHFTALAFTAPAEIQFRHKLEGFDSEWVDDATTRFARYGRLPYGDYRFRVALRNTDGHWQEAKQSFAFIVPTPLYYQKWAICFYVLTAIAMIAGIVRLVSHRRLRFALAQMEQQQSLERERMRIARDLHDEIGSKLAKISFLSEHAQANAEVPAPLAGKINSIAQTTRELLRTMDEIVWVVNPRNDTLENLVTYLGHYAAEYFQNTSIQCEIKLPQEMPQYLLSSEMRHNLFLTFEEALNNVLRHSGTAIVNIEMSLNGVDFEVKVTDSGKGFEVPSPAANGSSPRGGRGGNGLKNMRQRLQDIGGECLISSKPGGGTTTRIRITINPKKQATRE
jgi:ligand-binding sensor domain-containing protein/signal transduction histidine kinase